MQEAVCMAVCISGTLLCILSERKTWAIFVCCGSLGRINRRLLLNGANIVKMTGEDTGENTWDCHVHKKRSRVYRSWKKSTVARAGSRSLEQLLAAAVNKICCLSFWLSMTVALFLNRSNWHKLTGDTWILNILASQTILQVSSLKRQMLLLNSVFHSVKKQSKPLAVFRCTNLGPCLIFLLAALPCNLFSCQLLGGVISQWLWPV